MNNTLKNKKGMLIILVLLVVTGVVLSMWFMGDANREKVSDSEKAPDRESFPIGDHESVKFENKTISIDVAKDIVLTENGDPKCMVLTAEGENPEADAICEQINQ